MGHFIKPVKSGDIDMRDVILLSEPDIDSLTYDKSDTETDIPLARHEKVLLRILSTTCSIAVQ